MWALTVKKAKLTSEMSAMAALGVRLRLWHHISHPGSLLIVVSMILDKITYPTLCYLNGLSNISQLLT